LRARRLDFTALHIADFRHGAHLYAVRSRSDEEKVQQARHKLESWKQAFRLDKKLQYKLEREQADAPSESGAKAERPKPKNQSREGKIKIQIQFKIRRNRK